jgi:5-(carboxyamino)imidazole ribonucleotide synthase
VLSLSGDEGGCDRTFPLGSLGVDERTGLPVVGMVGAGQLARMSHQAAIALGQSLRIMADSPDDGAALVAADVVVGDYRSLADLRAFAAGCDVVTFDHEHVPNDHLAALAADGVPLQPGADALRFAQDKATMRTKLTAMGVPVPRWVDLTVPDDPAATLAEFGQKVGWPLVLKAARGGYDGKGVWVLDSLDDAREVLASGTPVLAEEKVPLARELAAVVARSPFGQGAAWCVVETVQRDGVCVEVIAPAPALPDDRADEAQQLALRIAAELGVTGVLAVELFETAGTAQPVAGYSGSLLVNELAMRPHNSGHWTIEGARTSQFEQHLRAVLDYPLGTTTLTAPVVVMANLLGGPDGVVPKTIDERLHHCLARWPDVKVHLYGKGLRPGRKIGHVTALGDDLAAVRERAQAAADYLVNGDKHG